MIGAVAFLERHLGVGAVDRAGRGEQQVLRRLVARELEDIERADDVGVDIGARIFEAVAHARPARRDG